jgi:hypothetical protein
MRTALPIAILVGLLAACAQPIAPPRGGQPASSVLHLVVAVRGAARLSRQGWSADTSIPLSFGAAVRAGDLIRSDVTAQVTVVCANLKIIPVPPGSSGVPCSSGLVTLRYADRTIIAPRGPDVSPEIPQVLSPRGSDLLDPHPLLRWRAVPGVDSYTVSIAGTTWEQEVRGASEVRYPNDAPPLTPGQTYKLIVVAGTHSSEDEGETGLGFRIVPDATAAPIRQTISDIQALSLDADGIDLLLATFYLSSELYAEAIDRLEALVMRSDAPAPWRQLGDLYLQVRLPDRAARCYQTALDHTPEDDLEGQALAHIALGEIAAMTGDDDQARTQLTSALSAFTALNDREGITQAEQALARLKPATPAP